MSKPISESLTLVQPAAADTDSKGLLEVEFISPGWGTSGYYSREVVEAAAPLFAVGTHLYFDHPHADGSGIDIHGNRSVKDLAAIVTEAGSVDSTTGAVRGKVQPLAPYRALLTDEAFAKNVGLSMRGSATDIVVGEAEGRTGPIVEGLAKIDSIDFVSRAGRGGRVLQVLESALPEQVVERAIAHGIAEATADERRQQLSDAVRTAYAGNDRYAWVQDFDETTVWFQASLESERSRTWEQSYEISADDMSVTLTGERIEVRPITKYVPVTRPDSNTPTTTESLEDNMAKIQIEESAHTALTEKAGRVDVLESENATQKARITELEEAADATTRANRARVLIAESGHAFDEFQVDGLLGRMTLTEGDNPVLDEEAFKTTVTEAATKVTAPADGTGLVGFGASAQTTQVAEAAPTTTPWGRELTTVKGA